MTVGEFLESAAQLGINKAVKRPNDNSQTFHVWLYSDRTFSAKKRLSKQPRSWPKACAALSVVTTGHHTGRNFHATCRCLRSPEREFARQMKYTHPARGEDDSCSHSGTR